MQQTQSLNDILGHYGYYDGYPSMMQKELYQSLSAGIDITQFADAGYNELQLRVLSQGLKRGLDIQKIMNPEFTHKQMDVLLDGLSAKISITPFLDPNLSPKEMKDGIKLAVQQKKDGIKPSIESLISNADHKVDKTDKTLEGKQKHKNRMDIPEK